MSKEKVLFIDCGAPSIYNEFARQKKPGSGAIMGSGFKERKNDSNEYIDSEFFCNYLDSYLEFTASLPSHDRLIFSALDAINDPENTHRIWKMFKEKGVDAIPAWHLGSDVSYLEKYLHEYKCPYIAIGGMTPNPVTTLLKPLDRLWEDHLTDSQGLPYAKYHGFAMTSFKLMVRYPWYSVDSSAANVLSRFGKVWIPNHYSDYSNPTPVRVSYHSGAMLKDKENIWNSRHSLFFKEFKEYVEGAGFSLGVTELKTVKEGYKKPVGSEYWFDRKKNVVGVILERGISNCYLERWKMNMEHLSVVESSMPTWPWAFKPKTSRFFK